MDLMIRFSRIKRHLKKISYSRPFCQVCRQFSDNKRVMKEVIQFSDNLFYITELIKTVSTASELTLKIDLFSEKISADISFINASLDTFTKILIDSTSSPGSIPNLRTLLKARASFKATLQQIIENPSRLFPDNMTELEYIKMITNRQEDLIQTIIDKMTELEQSEDNSVFITTEEMNLLLKE